MGLYLDVTVVSEHMTRHFSTEVAEQGGSWSKLRCSNHPVYHIHLKYMVRISKRLTGNGQEATRGQITPPDYWVTPCFYELSKLLHKSVSLLTQTHPTSSLLGVVTRTGVDV